MKVSDKPQISKKWWTSEKPADVKGTDLEKALQAAEKAQADEKKKSDAASIDAFLAAIADLEAAVDKTVKKELDKKKHKDVIAVLEKFYDLADAETKRLEDAKEKLAGEGDEDAEEEETENKLLEPDYLYKMIKLMKGGGKDLRFGFGLNTQTPESSKLVLSRKGKPEMLFKLLKRGGEFSNRTLTYGFAAPDPEQKKTLVFRLEESAGEPPQVIKLGRRFLRNDKKLYFRKLKVVMPGGQTFEDNEPDLEDTEGTEAAAAAAAPGTAGGAAAAAPGTAAGGAAAAAGDLQQRLRSAATAGQIWSRSQQTAASQIEQLRRELNAFDDPDVVSVRDRLANVLDRFPKLDFDSLARSTDAAAFDRTFATTKAGIAQWRQALERDPALRAIDENPFSPTQVVSTLGDALTRIAGELKV
jgi:hypothetical protein